MNEISIDTLIVGAGWSGLSVAKHLSDSGRQVVVVEKGRGPGGRCATRRHEPWQFDHGAQYFTATTPEFQAELEHWHATGVVAPWHASIESFGPRPLHLPDPQADQALVRWVGVPGNNAPLSAMAKTQTVFYQHRVTDVEFHQDHWLVVGQANEASIQWRAKTLVLTAPPKQAAALLGVQHPLHAQLDVHPMAPTWAVLMGFDETIDTAIEAAFINDGPLSWVCRQSAKPSRQGEAWVVHASSQWSEAHLEKDEDWVVEALVAAWQDKIGVVDASPSHCRAHRWRYAQSLAPLDGPFLSEPQTGLFVAGDWCHGNRVEGAWLSGRAVANALCA